MLVTDEDRAPKNADGSVTLHTSRRFGALGAHRQGSLSRTDGLATLGDLITVTINPMQMGEPHPHNPGQEEIWVAIDGTSLAFMERSCGFSRQAWAI